MNLSIKMSCIVVAFLLVANVPSPALQYEVIDIGTLGGSYGYAYEILDGGVIAGWATTSPGVKHAVLWDGGIIDLGAPEGFIVSEAVVINESGQVAANGEGSPQSYRAYRWENGTWTTTPAVRLSCRNAQGAARSRPIGC